MRLHIGNGVNCSPGEALGAMAVGITWESAGGSIICCSFSTVSTGRVHKDAKVVEDSPRL